MITSTSDAANQVLQLAMGFRTVQRAWSEASKVEMPEEMALNQLCIPQPCTPSQGGHDSTLRCSLGAGPADTHL